MNRDLIALVHYIENRIAQPYAYGANDCASFVLGAVEAQFAKPPPLAVTWKTETGAKRVIARLGGFEAAVDGLFRSIEHGQAAFGDIAGVIDPDRGFLVMLVEGQTLVAPGEHGLYRIPRNRMIRAWSSEPRP